ncbi:MAG: ribonuclease III [Janthinobacterium lividum]
MAKRSVANPETPENPADALQRRIRYQFRDAGLLQLALTHSSLAFERGEPSGQGTPNLTTEDNEQLEFLGDAVVGLIITELLCRYFPERREGDLTRMRALLVSGKRIGEAGIRLQLGSALHLGRGEDASGGRSKLTLLADAMEALVAAIYLDAGLSGLKAARTFVEREIFQPHLEELRSAAQQGARFGGVVGDWKSALQEWLQAHAEGQPVYRTVEETGSDHDKRFRVEVLLRDDVLAQGEGTSKKSAQQAAARLAYDRLAPPDAALGSPA